MIDGEIIINLVNFLSSLLTSVSVNISMQKNSPSVKSETGGRILYQATQQCFSDYDNRREELISIR